MKKIIILTLCFFSWHAHAESVEKLAKDFVFNQQKTVQKELLTKEKKVKVKKLYEEIDKTFATEEIYRFVVARQIKLINNEQKELIIDYFKKLILVTYVIESELNTSNLELRLNDTIIEKLPNGSQKITIDGDVIDTKKTMVLDCDFVVLYKNNQFRIYDIKLEKISMLISFRNMFSNMMQKNMGNVDNLIGSISEYLKEMDVLIYGTKKEEKIEEVFILQ